MSDFPSQTLVAEKRFMHSAVRWLTDEEKLDTEQATRIAEKFWQTTEKQIECAEVLAKKLATVYVLVPKLAQIDGKVYEYVDPAPLVTLRALRKTVHGE